MTKKSSRRIFAIILSIVMVLGVAPVSALASDAPIISGNSVYRSSAESATMRFLSDTAGTAYYQLTESSAAPSTSNLSTWTNAGDVTANVTKTLTLAVTSGAKYAHIVVQGDGGLSNVLSVEMVSNYCYSEDFEAHPTNTYIAQSGSPLSPISQKYGGNGSANQIVVSESDNKFLSLSSSSTASMHVMDLPSNYRQGATRLLLKGKVKPLSEGNYHEAALFGIGDRINGVLFINGKICLANKADINNITYNFNQWYEIELDVDLLTNKYSIIIDGTTVAENLTYNDSARFVTIFAGHNTTAYFDDISISALAIPIAPDTDVPIVSGNCVFRSSAESATVRFFSDKKGTAFYQITGSAQAPSTADLAAWVNGGAVTANATKTLSLATTSGVKYIHIFVSGDAGFSNVLTVSMLSDYCFSDDFDAYALGTYIAQSGAPMSPISQVNNGTGNSNQKVAAGVGTNNTKMLSLSSSSSWASDQIAKLDRTKLAAANSYVFEGDVCVRSTENAWQARFSVGNGNYEGTNEAGVFFKNGKILQIGYSWKELAPSYTANEWHHIKLVMDPSVAKYAVFVDGVLLAFDLPMPNNIDRLALTAGHGKTAYYDNFVFYTSDEHLNVNGKCGESLNWSISNDGKLKFTGSGAMTSTPWKMVQEDIKKIEFFPNCTAESLCDGAFEGFSQIKRIALPDTVTAIGENAFKDCVNLESVALTNSVTDIGEFAFDGCGNLTVTCFENSAAHNYAVDNAIPVNLVSYMAKFPTEFDDTENVIKTRRTLGTAPSSFIITKTNVVASGVPSLQVTGGQFYGTGSTITVSDGGLNAQTYVLSVSADINGDSAVDVLDIALSEVNIHNGSFAELTAAQKTAMDVNDDDVIDELDFQQSVNICLGKD